MKFRVTAVRASLDLVQNILWSALKSYCGDDGEQFNDSKQKGKLLLGPGCLHGELMMAFP